MKEGDEIKVTIYNWFPVDDVDAKKYIVLSTTTWVGGKNTFLAWVFIVISVICILLAIVFAIELLCGRGREVKSYIDFAKDGTVRFSTYE